MRGAEYEKMEEALVICVEQLKMLQNVTPRVEVIKDRAKMVCEYCTLLLY
jgi:hypothetical protein